MNLWRWWCDRSLQTVAFQVAFIFRAEIVVVATATSVSERRALSRLSVEKETRYKCAAIAGGFLLRTRRSQIAFADFLLQSFKRINNQLMTARIYYEL